MVKNRKHKKVAYSVKEGLENSGINVSITKTEDAGEINYFDYDLICIGFPSYAWHPPKPVVDLLKNNLNKLRKEGLIKPNSPRIPNKYALIFCTYSGPHTGLDEATPAGDYAGQFFDHIGFEVLDKWYILSEYHGSEERSTKGRMGDIRGKPTLEDLEKIKKKAESLARKI